MIECPEFRDARSPAELRVFRLTDDLQGASLVYPDRPSFLADGRRFIVETAAGPAVCDLDANAALRPLFPPDGPRRINVAPDGRCAFFTRPDPAVPDALTIGRVELETGAVTEVFHADGLLPGTDDVRAAQFGIATVSADSRRLAGRVTLGDGKGPDTRRCVIALDLESGRARHVVEDFDFTNPHLQYCLDAAPEACHDLLIQMNHGAYLDQRTGTFVGLGPPAAKGIDVHVIRDDGTEWRDLPFGRDGLESCIGHQIWRGRTREVVTVTLQNLDTSYGWADGSAQEVVAGWPQPADKDQPHLGRLRPGARRVLLSAGYPNPRFCHLACAANGLRLVFDTFPIFDGQAAGMQLFVGRAPNAQSPLRFTYLLNSRVTFNKPGGYHAHPILSPDGEILLFNSNIGGIPQVYLATGFAW